MGTFQDIRTRFEVDRTDGITSLAKLKFSYDNGVWGKDGRPGNIVPTKLVNTKVE